MSVSVSLLGDRGRERERDPQDLFLPPPRSQRLNLGCQAWQQTPLLAETFQQFCDKNKTKQNPHNFTPNFTFLAKGFYMRPTQMENHRPSLGLYFKKLHICFAFRLCACVCNTFATIFCSFIRKAHLIWSWTHLAHMEPIGPADILL